MIGVVGTVSGQMSPAARLVSRRRCLDLSCPAVMGVLNVTPDSFSDGGEYTDTGVAIARALTLVEQGAAIVDIGGESTRPGASPVSPDEEMDRVLPVVEGLRAINDVFISVDTSTPTVMRAAGTAGADMINDVRGLQAEGALETVAETGLAACVMHMQGTPATMQQQPRYRNVVAEVHDFLQARIIACEAAGIARERLCIDPGFGFGKTLAHNLALLRALSFFVDTGLPVLMGVSRKAMFARLFERDDLESRINGSLGAAFWAVLHNIGIIRCHDVRETAQMVTLAHTLTCASAADN